MTVVYLTTLSIAQTRAVYRRLLMLLKKHELERIRKETVFLWFRALSQHLPGSTGESVFSFAGKQLTTADMQSEK
jgi:hypothetical protein